MQSGLPAHRGFQKALAGTVHFDVTPNWLVKVELHDINGTQALNLSAQPNGLAGLKKDWRLFVTKTTFHFYARRGTPSPTAEPLPASKAKRRPR